MKWTDFKKAVKNWFKGIGEWFKENWLNLLTLGLTFIVNKLKKLNEENKNKEINNELTKK